MDSSELKNKRLSNRFPYNTSVPYTIGSKHGMGSVVNLSQDGMLFTTKDSLSVGEKINIDCQFRHGRNKMNLNGRIVRIAPDGVGIKFLWL
jgi:Tfp pilus assembly protein PilZ